MTPPHFKIGEMLDTSGFDLDGAFNGDEGQMLDDVVKRVVKILSKKTRLYVANYPTGLDLKVKDFETTVLRQQHEKVQVLGIVGCGGLGKTTLALEFFNRKRSEYSKYYFLSDVRENAKSSSNLLQLQRELLKGLTLSDCHVDNIHQGTQKLKELLSSSQVLVVLDDIDHEDQVDKLLPERDSYCSNSLILITSRDGNVLRRSRVKESSIYKLTGLAAQHSLELFCSYAFCQPYPVQGFEDLVDKLLMVCDGLPLSLKVFGGLLFGKDDKSFWEDTLHQVHEVPNDILECLRISYDALNEEEQQIFLDIACFFIGEDRDTITRVWDGSGWKGLLGFQNLESKCLVEVDSNNCIRMHDHLRDMGRKIGLDILPRRIWRGTESIGDLLQQCYVKTEVRGIRKFLNTGADSDDKTLSWWYQRRSLFGIRVMKLFNRLHNTPDSFLGIGVKNLQLVETEGHLLELILRRVHSPNLTWLSWRECPYSYLPSWIPMKSLRVLRVKGKELKTLWQGRSQAPFHLRVLEISGPLSNISKSIGQLEHLERIVLCDVVLQKLPDKFCHMKLLKTLVLGSWDGLKELPDSFGNLKSLQHIQLHGCGRLERLPDSFGNLQSLQHIKLCGTYHMERLPDSFGNLKSLQYIKLLGCGRLDWLPDSFGNLQSLQHIELHRCGRLPDSFGNLQSLQHIELRDCVRLERLPDSFGNLQSLQHILLSRCRSLERLPDSFGKLKSLQRIELSECGSLDRLPDSFGNLKNLQHIELSWCKSLKMLPDSFCNLTNLEHIEVSWCESLERLPDSFGNFNKLQQIKLSECTSLERLSDSFGTLKNLQCIELSGCKSLKRLPDSLGNLRNIQFIKLSGCGSLERLPESFGDLMNLQHIELHWCQNLQRLPNSFGNLKNLQHIELHGCESLQRLPDSFGNLTKLQHITLDHCLDLQRLPYSFGNLTNLQYIKLRWCNTLQDLPDSFGNLMNLKHITLSHCKNLQELSCIKTMLSLEELVVINCEELKSIADFAQLTKLKLLDVRGCFALEDGVEHVS